MKSKKDLSKPERLVLGVLDLSSRIAEVSVASKYRDFTISWSRYDYRGEMIEADTVNAILNRACELGFHWCLILPYGHVIAERWRPDHWPRQDFLSALHRQMQQDDFLIAGSIIGGSETWYGFENECVLVNLEMYQQLSSPNFDATCPQPIDLPGAKALISEERIGELRASSGITRQRPILPGWQFIATSLDNDVRVPGFDESLGAGILDLSASDPVRCKAINAYLTDGISQFDRNANHPDLGDEQVAFLNLVQPQTTGARNGVFLWNIESYDDIETPSEEFQSPIDSVYCVAAGFKPNRILQTHGWDRSTRVVYFDYSPRALEIRKYMVEHWDGDHFSEFVQHLFHVYPHPDTFYQLWDGLTPSDVDADDIERMWQRELQRWGDADAFREHWRDYTALTHEYVDCNLMSDVSPLLDRMMDEPSSIIWWSNAFFTVYGNWHYSLEQRKAWYDDWIHRLCERNPNLIMYGSDYNNINVNAIRAGEYWDAYRRSGNDWLTPCRLSKTEIRM